MRGWWRKRYGGWKRSRQADAALVHITPITPEGLRQYDHLDPVEAVVRAWMIPGKDRAWHIRMRGLVRRQMPLLARSLDALAAERYSQRWEGRSDERG